MHHRPTLLRASLSASPRTIGLSGVLVMGMLACGSDDDDPWTPTTTNEGGSGGTGASGTGGSLGGGGGQGGGGVGGNVGGGSTSGSWISGYYVGYQSASHPPAEVDFGSLTHVVVGAVLPQTDGSLNTEFYMDATSGPAMAQTMVSLAHAANTQAILMIGGAGTHDGWVGAASPANRATFVTNLLQLVDDYGYDGLDIDWEPVMSADEPNLEALLTDLRTAQPDLLITIPVGWVSSNTGSVESFYGTIAPLVDQMNLMTYSMADSWSGWDSWHSSALHGESSTTPSSVSSSIDAYLAAGVPAAKLGVGLGFYGSCWGPPVTGPGQTTGGSQVIAGDNVMSYTNIATLYNLAARQWDDSAKVPYLSYTQPSGPNNCTFVSYEDSESITEKMAYVQTEQLGGAIIWTISEGYMPNAPANERNPLSRAAWQGLFE